MRPRVSTVVARLLGPDREGTAFTNDPNDAGGPTKFGITIPFLADARGVPAEALTAADIEALTENDAESVYSIWMMRTQLAALPSLAVMDTVTDYAVHSGLVAAVEALQRAVGAKVDGGLGSVTLGLVGSHGAATIVILMTADRLARWSRRFAADPSQRLYASAWNRRLADVLSADNSEPA